MNKIRYIRPLIPPPIPSSSALEAVKREMENRPSTASIKEQLIKQEKKGESSWNWNQEPKGKPKFYRIAKAATYKDG